VIGIYALDATTLDFSADNYVPDGFVLLCKLKGVAEKWAIIEATIINSDIIFTEL
jgi:hypothetical protein